MRPSYVHVYLGFFSFSLPSLETRVYKIIIFVAHFCVTRELPRQPNRNLVFQDVYEFVFWGIFNPAKRLLKSAVSPPVWMKPFEDTQANIHEILHRRILGRRNVEPLKFSIRRGKFKDHFTWKPTWYSVPYLAKYCHVFMSPWLIIAGFGMDCWIY